MTVSRLIAHVDMDAFFASVALLRYPQLRGLPVVIGGGRAVDDPPWAQGLPPAAIPVSAFPRLRDYVGRGVITTATYPARAFGVGSAMGLMQAARRCPQAILLPVAADDIKRASRAFKAALLARCPVMEDRGVDEVYLDFTEVPGAERDRGQTLARELQGAVLAATGLTCSIGVAPNKLLAKLASEFAKPAGVTWLGHDDLAARVWPLPCGRLNGIGPRTQARLADAGIDTLGDLAAADPAWLIQRFGDSQGRWLHAAAHGRDQRPLTVSREPVSLSRETTFGRDLDPQRDRERLGEILHDLCVRLADDLARKGVAARTVGIKLRHADFTTLTRDQTGCLPVLDADSIRDLARQCLRRVPMDSRVRLLGVRASGLVPRQQAMTQPAQLRLPSVA